MIEQLVCGRWKRPAFLAVFALLPLGASAPAPEQGTLLLRFLDRPVGEERYTVERASDGLAISAHLSYTERGSTVTLEGALRTAPDLTPRSYVATGRSYRPFSVDAAVQVNGARATVHDDDRPPREVPLPPRFFTISGYSPFAVQMIMLRYWLGHGRPAHLPQLPAGDDLVIHEAGHDVVASGGGPTMLTRFTIGNVVWGDETVWLDPQQRIAAAATYAGNLPLEAVAPAFEAVLPQLLASADRDRFAKLTGWRHGLSPLARGRYAIKGARLIDGTGAAPVEDITVIVDGDRIAAVGRHLPIAPGVAIVDGRGQTLLPGLWEMHAHFAQVEYGPAYLAAGITTARDLGGEPRFLTRLRDLLDGARGLGPHLLLGCLVDGSGPNSFGTTYADTPAEARAIVRRCKAAGYVQMKVYDYIRPEVLRAIAEEAHRLGMTVTGHIPRGMTAQDGVLAGMDQINHLGAVLDAAKDGGRAPLAADAPSLRRAIAFFKDHHTVIDPTQAWGELLGRPRSVPIASFEPGFDKAPYTLRTMLGSSGVSKSSTAAWGISDDAALLIRGLYQAGVPIVAGTDKALPAHSLHRELELYVKAGLTPLEVIRLATEGSARVMRMDHEVGTVTPGKRADLILVAGDPLADFSALRRVRKVVTAGRLYDAARLWQMVGFKP